MRSPIFDRITSSRLFRALLYCWKNCSGVRGVTVGTRAILLSKGMELVTSFPLLHSLRGQYGLRTPQVDGPGKASRSPPRQTSSTPRSLIERRTAEFLQALPALSPGRGIEHMHPPLG